VTNLFLMLKNSSCKKRCSFELSINQRILKKTIMF